MKNNKVLLIVYCGLFAALVVIATALLKIPTAIGYVNLGDGGDLCLGGRARPVRGGCGRRGARRLPTSSRAMASMRPRR